MRAPKSYRPDFLVFELDQLKKDRHAELEGFRDAGRRSG